MTDRKRGIEIRRNGEVWDPGLLTGKKKHTRHLMRCRRRRGLPGDVCINKQEEGRAGEVEKLTMILFGSRVGRAGRPAGRGVKRRREGAGGDNANRRGDFVMCKGMTPRKQNTCCKIGAVLEKALLLQN